MTSATAAPYPLSGTRLKIAYMLGTYPALTETFVLREIGALRRRGVDIAVCAVRRSFAGQHAETSAFGAGSECIYARPDATWRHLRTNFRYLVRRPVRYLGALSAFLNAAAGLAPKEALQLLYHFVAGVGFSRDLHRLGVHHVHCHFTSATNMALAAHLVDGLSFSFTAHASGDLFVKPVLLDEKLARARFVVTVCEYSRHFLDSVTGFYYGGKLHRIYNGLERQDGQQAQIPASRAPAAAEHRIVSVGSLVAAKGHATLLQVLGRVRARGESFQCRIIGEGPERPTLERIIRENDLGESVALVGARSLEDVYAELREADVFVLLSEIGRSGYRDGFPTVILEAMAAGLPVLSTSLSGIPEMVVHGETGLLVRERDVEGASQALECLLHSAELRRAMGHAGQRRVRDAFDLDHSAERLAALFSQCMPDDSTSSHAPAER